MSLPISEQQYERVEKICSVVVDGEAQAWDEEKHFQRVVTFISRTFLGERRHHIGLYSTGMESWLVWVDAWDGQSQEWQHIKRSEIFPSFYLADVALDHIIFGC